MPRPSSQERWQGVGMLSCGMVTRQVARHFKCDHSTTVRLNHRFQATGTTDDRPRPGQPRVTTPALDRQIRLTHQRNRFQTATQTAAVTPDTRGIISTSTVRWRLRTYGLQNRRPYTGTILTRRHQMNRLAEQHNDKDTKHLMLTIGVL
jgi:transposase